MKNKVLSVSIAAYNVAGTLREALDPFLESGVLDALDIMIVNDGSKDNTVEIATEYVAKYPGTFRLIDKENGGWGSTVNIGIEITAESPDALLELAEKVRTAVISFFENYTPTPGEEDLTPLIPNSYTFGASQSVYDPDKPCFRIVLTYACDTTP